MENVFLKDSAKIERKTESVTQLTRQLIPNHIFRWIKTAEAPGSLLWAASRHPSGEQGHFPIGYPGEWTPFYMHAPAKAAKSLTSWAAPAHSGPLKHFLLARGAHSAKFDALNT